ncbi:hypothetical protein EGW08_020366 [Elysia chlorotica]|uniref:Uncharacterized protein n=1 Tax=Elysia chlorotica TaxID=188477 RepID=A0A433SRK9_ELYCH|nr:hypothetical protein EGW08_020366 [Elysia chlorotica]
MASENPDHAFRRHSNPDKKKSVPKKYVGLNDEEIEKKRLRNNELQLANFLNKGKFGKEDVGVMVRNIGYGGSQNQTHIDKQGNQKTNENLDNGNVKNQWFCESQPRQWSCEYCESQPRQWSCNTVNHNLGNDPVNHNLGNNPVNIVNHNLGNNPVSTVNHNLGNGPVSTVNHNLGNDPVNHNLGNNPVSTVNHNLGNDPVNHNLGNHPVNIVNHNLRSGPVNHNLDNVSIYNLNQTQGNCARDNNFPFSTMNQNLVSSPMYRNPVYGLLNHRTSIEFEEQPNYNLGNAISDHANKSIYLHRNVNIPRNPKRKNKDKENSNPQSPFVQGRFTTEKVSTKQLKRSQYTPLFQEQYQVQQRNLGQSLQPSQNQTNQSTFLAYSQFPGQLNSGQSPVIDQPTSLPSCRYAGQMGIEQSPVTNHSSTMSNRQFESKGQGAIAENHVTNTSATLPDSQHLGDVNLTTAPNAPGVMIPAPNPRRDSSK